MTAYVQFLVVFLWVPLVVVLVSQHWLVWRYKKTVGIGVLSTFAFGTPWDMLSVVTGLWRYDVSPTLGVWFYVLPLEEVLFTLTFPVLLISLILIARRRFRRPAHVR